MNQKKRARKKKKQAERDRHQAARRQRLQRQRQLGLLSCEVLRTVPVTEDGSFDLPC